MRRVLVLRPEPGNAATCRLAAAAGLEPVALPLFETVPLAWVPPAGGFDAVLLTSANAVRHAGAGLATLALPVVAVGPATAAAARGAGLTVALAGTRDVAQAVAAARAQGFARLLHLAGRDHVAAGAGATFVPVYASEARVPPTLPPLEDATALLHSRRAAEAFAALVSRLGADRTRIALVAISPAALAGAGPGWRSARAADLPDEAAMLRLVVVDRDVDRDGGAGDKTA